MAELPNTLIEKAIGNLQKTEENMRLPVKAIKRLFDSFINSALPHTQEMLEAIEKEDYETVKTKAHAIRGIALSLSFDEIAEMCNLLEYQKTDTPADTITLLNQSISQLIEVQEEILAGFEAKQ